MGIVVLRQDGKADEWKRALRNFAPEVPVYSAEEPHPKAEIEMALVWKHPKGSLSEYPNLKCIASSGAGVDFIFKDTQAPLHLPITRVVDPILAKDMAEHVIATVFAHLKNVNTYKLQQFDQTWKPRTYLRMKEVTIGILGLGELGAFTATELSTIGFKVQGWSRSQKEITSVTTFNGPDQLDLFLGSTDVLVCLLPLTPNTQGILNKKIFEKLPKNAFLINVARGGHLNDDDLLEALDSGHLSGAALDVFHTEPLPGPHPFWQHPKVHMSPHCASVSDTESVVPQIIANYKRLKTGKALENEISKTQGY